MTLLPALLIGLLAGAQIRASVQVSDPDAPKDLPPAPQVTGIEIEPHLGQSVPLDLPFVDHDGKVVKLRDYVSGVRPMILVLNYYSCPTLCSLMLNGVVVGLRGLPFVTGKDYQVVSVSIDHRERPALALKKREAYLTSLHRETAPGAWPFLTGAEGDISRLAEGVGFKYRYDQASNQYAHAAGIFVLTPEGRVSQVLYGIDFSPRDLRLSLVEASKGAIGTPVDRLLLLCYHYDPQTRKYTMTALTVMRLGGGLTVIALCVFLVALWRRERRAQVVHD